MVSPLSRGSLIPTNITGNEEKLRNEQRLQHSGRIPYFTFKYLGVGFFVMAALAAAARIIVRIHIRRFGLGDCFVLLAIISLSGATTLMVHYTRHLFLVEALSQDHGYIITSEDIKSFGSVLRIAFCFPILPWTATIAIKLYFLVLFRELTKRVSKKITIYIWAVILLTATLGIFSWSATFIACFLNGSHHCMIMFTDKRSFIMDITASIFSLFGTKTVLVVIIPVLILRISQMKPTQKLGLATFLCLSIFTFLICAIRIAGSTHRHSQLDVTWDWFLIHIEACVATIMASVSAFSPFFFSNHDNMNKAEEKKGKRKEPLAMNQELGLQNNKIIDRSGWGDVGREGFPTAPLATLARIHRFLYEDASLMEGAEISESINHSVNEESRPYVLSASTEENDGKESVCSLIAPP